MKTAEEILEKWELNFHFKSGDWTHNSVIGAMKEYASQRESKYKELCEAMKEYRILCKSEFDGILGIALVHGWQAREEDIKRGEEFRQKIAEFEKELGLCTE